MLLCRKVKIDPQGRVQIPKEMMKEAELKPGDTLYVSVDEDSKVFVITQSYEGIGDLFELIP